MELENEPEQFVSFPGERVIDQVRDGFVLDRDPAAIRVIEQAEDIE